VKVLYQGCQTVNWIEALFMSNKVKFTSSLKPIREIVDQVIVAVLLGIITAIVANGFVEGVRWAVKEHPIDGIFNITIGDISLSYKVFVTMGLAGLLILLIRKLLNISEWAGPAESIYAVQQYKETLDIRRGLGSTVVAFVAAGGGASVGQYGPLVHFGATIAVILRNLSKISISQNIVIACGVAGAISAGFHAPIAGVVFAHEALLRKFSVGAIAPISVTAIVAYATNQYFFQTELTFFVPTIPIDLNALIPFLLLSAPICCLVVISYMHVLRQTKHLVGASKWSFKHQLLGCIVVAGIIGMVLPDVLGLGISQINQMINNEFTISYLFMLLMGKIIMTALCINTGFFGGIFGPALFIGAATGGIVAYASVTVGLSPEMSHSLSVAVMAAVGAAVIGAPLTVIIIVIELTGSYAYGLSAMLCVILCSTLTLRLFGLSYFDRQLLDLGIDMRIGQEHIALLQINVTEIRSSSYIIVEPHTSIAETQERMQTANLHEAYVCNEENVLLGKVSMYDLAQTMSLDAAMDSHPLYFITTDSLVDAMKKITTFTGETIPIVSQGRLINAISEGDLFHKILEVQERIRTH
jgi:CIC family chloride channel protein